MFYQFKQQLAVKTLLCEICLQKASQSTYYNRTFCAKEKNLTILSLLSILSSFKWIADYFRNIAL